MGQHVAAVKTLQASQAETTAGNYGNLLNKSNLQESRTPESMLSLSMTLRES